MILSDMEFRICFSIAKYENDIHVYFHYVRYPMSLFMLFAIPKSIFVSQGR